MIVNVWLQNAQWVRLPAGAILVPNTDPGASGPMLIDSAAVVATWTVAAKEAAGIYAVTIPDPPAGQAEVSEPTFQTGGDGRPEAVVTFATTYPDLTSAQFAEFFISSGLSAPWLAKEALGDGVAQLLLTERTSAPYDISSVLAIRTYLETLGETVPDETALRAAWLAAIEPKPAVPLGEPYDPARLYVARPGGAGDTCTFGGRLYEWILPWSVPGYEPGPATWAAWLDRGAIGPGVQPWTQRTPGVDMYGVGPHADGAAAIGTLQVTFGGLTYLLIAPDNWGFDPPTSIANIPMPNTPWQLV